MSLEDAFITIFRQIASGFWSAIWFLGGLLGCIALVLVIIALLRLSKRSAQITFERHQNKKLEIAPNGTPLPTLGRGICDECAQLFEKVYFLPAGDKLCPGCFQARQLSCKKV